MVDKFKEWSHPSDQLPEQSTSRYQMRGQDHPELTFNGGRTWEEEPTFSLFDAAQLVSPKVMLGWGTNTNGTAVFWYSADRAEHWAQRALPVGPLPVGRPSRARLR